MFALVVMVTALLLAGSRVAAKSFSCSTGKGVSSTWRWMVQFALVMFGCAMTPTARGGQQLHGHVPAAVAALRPVDRLATAQHLHLAIGLPTRNPAELKSLLEDLYNPASPNFRHYLTPAEFTEQFGPTDQDYQSVVDFMQSNGLKVTATHPNRLVLEVDGAIPEIEKAFHVTLHNYQHPRESRKFYAPDAEPSLDLAVPLVSISGLDNYWIPRPNHKIKPLDASAVATPHAGSAPGGAYGGGDFRAAYVPGTTLTGAGQSVGLLQFDAYYESDITAYKTRFGLPDVPLYNVAVNGGVSAPGTGNGEVCLDIEMVLAMAPGVSAIYVYEAPNSTSNFLPILNRMVSDNLCKQLSCSWGGGTNNAESVFQQMAAQGQSFFNATGDSDAFTGVIPFPSDSPSITEVGATTLTTTGAGGSYVSEKVWNWGLVSGSYMGSSGGTSTVYTIPTWQAATSMATNQGSTTMRNVPDVALTGDNIYVTYNNGAAGAFGGTSCAAPLWAGFTALMNQQAAAAGRSPVGFINPAIYAIGNSANYTTNFRDTTTGNNYWLSSTTKFAAVSGYDLCTGWGCPAGTALINALAVPFAITTTSPLPTSTVGIAYSQTLDASGGTAPYTWSITAGSLPEGLSLSSDGVISGTPPAATTATFTVQATGSDSLSVTKAFSLAITPHYTIPFTEGFENAGLIPSYWTQEYVTLTQSWIFRKGSSSNRPTTTHSGSYNALLYNTTATNHITKLVTPPIDFGANTVNAQLTFWHYMQPKSGRQDQLKIYYKASADGAWTLLSTYAASVTTWTQHTVSLPNPSGSYYIAFEGNALGGYGVCVDDVQVTGSSTKTAATVNLTGMAQTYDGTPKSAGATTTPAGLAVSLTYNGSSIAPTAVGNYAVVGTINDANYEGSASGTLVISKATAGVTLSALSQTYDGTPKPAGAATTPAGLTVSLTYNGSSTAPTNVGSYAVVGTINDANYQGSTSGTLVIGKGTATVSLNSLSQVYDGTPKSAGATTMPAGLTVGLTYNGSSTAPTAAGSYVVVGTINDANYQGTVSGTLVIGKAAATVALNSLSRVYDGTAKPAGATTTPGGLTVSLTYNGSATVPTDAGSYAVVATVSDANYQGTASGTLVIGKAAATVVLSSLSQVYDGTPKSAGASTTPGDIGVGLTYNGSATVPTDAGSYAVVATVSDANYQGMASGTFNIGKGTATVALDSLSQVYDGTPKPAGTTTTPVGLTVSLTYNGSATVPVDAGSYAVVATVNDPNYQGTSSGTLVIQQAAAAVSLTALSQTYDGTLKSVAVTVIPAGLSVGLTYDGSATVPVDAGSYAVVATVSDVNYQGSASGTLVIQKAAATVAITALVQTYDGAVKPAGATTTPERLSVDLIYDGSPTAPTHAGDYAVAATINDRNYQGEASATLVIHKAVAGVVLDGLSRTYDGAEKPAVATTTPTDLAVDLTYDGSPAAPTGAGNYAVVATIHDTDYQGDASGTLVIQKAPATVVLDAPAQTYDGTAKLATATATPAGLAVDLTYDGSPVAPVDAGSYPVVATVNDANYQGEATATLVIDKASAEVSLDSLDQTYDGSPKVVGVTTLPGDLAVDLDYAGSSTAPTNAGRYVVAATIDEPNYQGSATGTLVIGRTTATVVIGSLSQVYDGSPRLVTVTTTPAGLSVDLTYDGSATAPTAAGSYAVVATINDVNYQGSAATTLVVSESSMNLSIWRDQHFSASEQSAGLGADGADPDGDGLTNLAEYALGSDPRGFSPPLVPTRDANGLSITFTRPANLLDVSYGAESSDDLIHWSPVPLEVLESGPIETVRARDPLTTGDPFRRMLRLRFER